MAKLDYTAPIADLLKSWRAAMDLSQSQAAAALGVPLGTLQHWEIGHRQPSPEGPLRIALKALAKR